MLPARLTTLTVALTFTMLIGAGAALPGVASAGVAKVIHATIPSDTPGDDPTVQDEPTYAAAAGEVNRVRVSQGPTVSGTSTVLFEDLGAVVTVGTGCTLVDAHHADCVDATYPVVELGDMNDTLTVDSGISAVASGGPGTDLLTGGDEADTLDGGGGAGDMLSGGAGDDTLSDGDGIGGAAVDADTLVGGPGSDTVDYHARSAGVTVDLSAGLAGQPGEGDHISSIENATGGQGADRLTGTPGPNTLDGGPGDDVLDAGAGADDLDGGAGDDQIEAGAGNDNVVGGLGDDTISLGSGNDIIDDSFQRTPTGVDTVKCGSGRDEIRAVQEKQADRLAADCERFTATETFADGNDTANSPAVSALLRGLHRHGQIVTLPIKCVRRSHDGPCVVAGELRSSTGRTLARSISRAKVKAGKQGVLRLRVTAAGGRKLRSGRRAVLVLAEHSKDTPSLGFELFANARSEADITLP